ncbi:hypothetical protein HanRHA438_Chr01g0010441 [Helianthus annuus]|nr:hypothetical protein HanRHA438_Chr01g0010441 [Helianthus annuus]
MTRSSTTNPTTQQSPQSNSHNSHTQTTHPSESYIHLHPPSTSITPYPISHSPPYHTKKPPTHHKTATKTSYPCRNLRIRTPIWPVGKS